MNHKFISFLVWGLHAAVLRGSLPVGFKSRWAVGQARAFPAVSLRPPELQGPHSYVGVMKNSAMVKGFKTMRVKVRPFTNASAECDPGGNSSSSAGLCQGFGA